MAEQDVSHFHAAVGDVPLLNDKPLSECSDEEILAEINRLRDRRASARERRIVARSAEEQSTRRKLRVGGSDSEVSATLGSALDAIFADDDVAQLCGKCSTVMIDGVCPNLSCE